MSEKRYQIFVSSTYSDLKEERLQLLYAILKLNYIPAGMEYFPAIDEEQLEFIKRIIDQSDYYVLLLGARYGSLDSEGISYTEREYDYAVTQGKKVIALIHENPDRIERGKTDKNEDLYNKFMAFRQKVIAAKRLVAFWTDTTDLVLNFQSSLMQTIQHYPAIGWMRGDSLANAETLQKIAALELENQRLKEHIKAVGGPQVASNIKMEACSVTAPTIFSEKEIECVALDILFKRDAIPDHSLFFPHKKYHSIDEVKSFYINEAIPWFCNIAKTCRFDLRITNPNPFVVKNMDAEQHFFDSQRNEISYSREDDRIESAPSNPDTDYYSEMTTQYPPAKNLNPQQSTMYTHTRYFKVERDFDMVYQRIIFAENILDPIFREITIHFRAKKFEMDINDLIRLIQNLEDKKKFNDAGVFEFVASVLAKEKEEASTNDMQTALAVQEGEEGDGQP